MTLPATGTGGLGATTSQAPLLSILALGATVVLALGGTIALRRSARDQVGK
jgi:hypothetical protein